MLAVIGYASLDDLIDATVPAGIRFRRPLAIHGGRTNNQRLMIDGLMVRNVATQGWNSNTMPDMGASQEMTIDYAAGSGEAITSGVLFNFVPREGGNNFQGSFFATAANSDFQGTNFTEELRAQGLRVPNRLKQVYDINPSGGGPILKDKLWFYVSGRWQTNQTYIPGSVGNANAGDPTKWLWVADPNVRGKFNTTQNSGSFRFTYQANQKHKFFASHEPQGRTWIDATAATSPESFTDYHFTLQRMSSAGWTGTLSNKLLASVKWGDHGEAFGDMIPPDAPYDTLITVHETGGLFFENNNDLLKGIRRAFSDGRQYYTLAYVPVNKNFDGKYRTIHVEVKGKNLVVAAKPGYWATN